MIGLSILAVVFGYIFLSKFIISKTYEKFGTKKAKYIATAIMVLIPTWDVILGFPIYAYLCATKAGVHIYKTVDNVEGFYVGEKDIANQPYEPYKGYKYIEYQEVKDQKPTGKYYRSYWVNYFKDRSESQYCVYPRYQNSPTHPYTKAFSEGKCIVKKEISEGEVSRWSTVWNSNTNKIKNYYLVKIYGLGISVKKVGQIQDRSVKKILSEQFSVDWNKGWLLGFLSSIETGHPKIKFCGIDYSNVFELEHKTLKPKNKEEK